MERTRLKHCKKALDLIFDKIEYIVNDKIEYDLSNIMPQPPTEYAIEVRVLDDDTGFIKSSFSKVVPIKLLSDFADLMDYINDNTKL